MFDFATLSSKDVNLRLVNIQYGFSEGTGELKPLRIVDIPAAWTTQLNGVIVNPS
jgi:hypothetical protein